MQLEARNEEVRRLDASRSGDDTHALALEVAEGIQQREQSSRVDIQEKLGMSVSRLNEQVRRVV